jgi:hypothetical protein
MENQAPEAVQPETPAAPAPELTIVDLQNIRSIIEVSARRGAFAANEMEAVGGTFNKLAKFLEAVAPQSAEGQTEEPTPAQ